MQPDKQNFKSSEFHVVVSDKEVLCIKLEGSEDPGNVFFPDAEPFPALHLIEHIKRDRIVTPSRSSYLPYVAILEVDLQKVCKHLLESRW